MKLKHEGDMSYSFYVKNANGLFTESIARIVLPVNFFQIIEFLKTNQKRKQDLTEEAFVVLKLKNKNIDLFSIEGQKINVSLKEDEVVLNFSEGGVPLNLCIKINEIIPNQDISINRALINSSLFISR